MKNKRRIIGIVAAMLLALIGTVALVGYVRSAKDEAVADEALVDVYVVDEFVPKGAEPDTIKSSVSVEQVPARLKQAGAITDLEALGDQVAATDLQPGDQLLAARLAAKELVSRGGHRQGADLGAARGRAGRRRCAEEGRPRRRLPLVRSVRRRRGRTGPRAEPSGRSALRPTPRRCSHRPWTDDRSRGDRRDGPKKTPNVSRLEFQHVLVTNVQTTSAPVDPRRRRATTTSRASPR